MQWKNNESLLPQSKRVGYIDLAQKILAREKDVREREIVREEHQARRRWRTKRSATKHP